MTDMTVLDRQTARQRWLPQQQSSFSFFNGALDDCMVTHLDNPATGFLAIEALGWPDLTAAAPSGGAPPAPGVSGADSAASAPKEAAGGGRSKKRKADDARAQEKRAEAKMEMSSDGSGEDSKAPPPPKQDYIHVRARRGQATDSHSLAERVRREKISERMKYLQELVPGCSKITGKAGMLDEIINYVQSLQKQVEFLSMKLATVNPRIDINIDQFFSKEIAQASNASFQMVGISPEVAESPYLHFNPLQQAFAYYGLDMAMNAPELAPRRTASATMSDTTFNSCPNANNSSFAWENLLQSGYNAEIDQGLRGFVFPFQTLQGNVVCNNPKMEL